MKQLTEKSQFMRILRQVGELILFIIAINIMVACTSNTPILPDNATSHVPSSEKPTMPPATPTAGLDFSTSRLSENGLFRVSYTSSKNIVPVNQIHQWTLHVETAEGALVENATITVDGDMPEHGHGLPTQPKVTKYLGNGDYLVEGMKFQMGGWWVMDFTITADSHTDAVHFNMKLN
ncbi:MAG TPA: FixH family protein [Anaerolineales bacterium]|nr:FixH family protein [Anaerolineales bacterium]